MGAIYKKELKAYFCNMPGYIFAAFLLAMTGVFFTLINLKNGYPNFEYVLSNVSFIFLLIVPVVTMRTFAEERHNKTDQLLYSLPMSLTKVVLGKFFALYTVFLVPMAPICLYPLLLSAYAPASGASVNLLSAYGAIFGFMLLGGALLAIGMFISSQTESQVVAAVGSFAVILVMYLMSSLTALIPSDASASLIAFALLAVAIGFIVYFMTKDIWVSVIVTLLLGAVLGFLYMQFKSSFGGLFAQVMNWFSLYDRYGNFQSGLFDLTAVVYYISLTVLFLFLSVQSVEKRRWS